MLHYQNLVQHFAQHIFITQFRHKKLMYINAKTFLLEQW